MAITSAAEKESELSQIIMVVIRALESNLSDLEKKMRSNEFVILQKKTLSEEEGKDWFPNEESSNLTEEAEEKNSEEPSDSNAQDDEVQTEEKPTCFAYVLQRRDANQTWQEFATDVGNDLCILPEDNEEQLSKYFPSVVHDDYLLQPESTTEFLNQIAPTLRAGLQQVCEDKPEDPIQYLADWLDKSNP